MFCMFICMYISAHKAWLQCIIDPKSVRSIMTLTACHGQHENNSQYEELHHSGKQAEEEKRLLDV